MFGRNDQAFRIIKTTWKYLNGGRFQSMLWSINNLFQTYLRLRHRAMYGPVAASPQRSPRSALLLRAAAQSVYSASWGHFAADRWPGRSPFQHARRNIRERQRPCPPVWVWQSDRDCLRAPVSRRRPWIRRLARPEPGHALRGSSRGVSPPRSLRRLPAHQNGRVLW